MKIITSILIFAVTAECGFGHSSSGISGEEDQGSKNSGMYFSAGISMINSYKIGNALDFWQTINNDNSENIEQATGFFVFRLGSIQPLDENKNHRIVAEGQLVIAPSSHTLWGTNLYFGGRNEIYFSPVFLNIILSYAHALDKEKKVLVTVEPGLDPGYMSGAVSINNNYYNESFTVGYGGHGALGLDYIPGSIIVNVRAGYRMISINEIHKDKNSSTGYSSF